MAYDDDLAQPIRDLMRDEPGVSEKKMFGGVAFLTAGNVTVGVQGDDLIARIDPQALDDALAEPGVRPFDMTGRPMRGWILVAGESLADDELDRWIGPARRYAEALPPKCRSGGADCGFPQRRLPVISVLLAARRRLPPRAPALALASGPVGTLTVAAVTRERAELHD